MCAACSPAGRPLTFIWITTPPLLASEIFAVPTGCPLASMRATVTGLLAANTLAAVNKPPRAKKAAGLVIFISTTCIVARFAAPSPAAPPGWCRIKVVGGNYGRTEMAVARCLARNSGNRLGAANQAARDAGGARWFHWAHPSPGRKFPRSGRAPAGAGVLAEPGLHRDRSHHLRPGFT